MSVDHLVLVSGDGDFDLLIDRLRQRFGIWVTVVGVAPFIRFCARYPVLLVRGGIARRP
ncbi:NYN domain-containing protein [Halomonas sp. A11-A]|uniref:NYN domain-containing protein n=1 Tax=Halomonas sp. A11-A TaxID=2183985 RepID=UPI000D716CCD